MIRIDKALSNRGYCTRKEVLPFLKAYAVLHEGKEILRPDTHIDPEKVTIDGEPLDPETLTVLVHKPLDFVCSREDRGSVIFELLPERYLRRNPALGCAGRLDKDSTGMVILTDVGKLVQKLISPKRHVGKFYEVGLAEPLRGDEAEIFRSGTMILKDEHEPLKPAEFEPVDERHCRVTLFEGRYHQVRRMFAALGNKVETLHRSTIGGLALGALPEGEWKILSEAELQQIFSSEAQGPSLDAGNDSKIVECIP